MSVEIRIGDDDALTIKGDFELKDEEGNVLREGGGVRLCRCGQSNRKPYCDNTHIKTNFESKVRA